MAEQPSDSGTVREKPNAVLVIVVFLGAACLALAAAYYIGSNAGQSGEKLVSVAPPGQEAEVLSAQVAEMQRSEDRLLTVVMGMMGISAAVLVAFGAIALYLGGQQYQRDKDAMETIIKADTENQIDSLKASESALRQEHLTSVNTGLRDLLRPYGTEIEGIKTANKNAAAAAIKFQNETLERMISLMEEDSAIRRQAERDEAEIDLIRRNYSSALAHYTTALRRGEKPRNQTVDYLDLSKINEILRGSTAANHWIPQETIDGLREYLSAPGSTFRWLQNQGTVNQVLKQLAAHTAAYQEYLSHQLPGSDASPSEPQVT